MPLKKKELKIVLPPGPKAFEAWLTAHSKVFNLSEVERLCNLPIGSLRYIRDQNRHGQFTAEQIYKQFKIAVLPNLLQLVMICQNYGT